MTKIRFPKIDANVVEGQVGAWLKEEGATVAEDEGLVELITDKANFELPCEAEGTLRKILAAEKSVVPVSYIIALVGEPNEDLPDVAEENDRIVQQHRADAAALKTAQTAATAPTTRETPKKKVRAKPAARRAAREAGIDLADVTAADGKIVTEQDVRAYLDHKGGQS